MTPCTHKQANHQCGTNARYHLDGCRCRSCREAAAAYERKRISWLVGIRPQGFDEKGKAFRCPNPPGTPWTPAWCWDCDERRRAHLTRQFEKLAKDLHS